MMPPPVDRKRKSFTKEDAATLRRWVAEGADYKGHWAFEKPLRPDPPPNLRATRSTDSSRRGSPRRG